MRNLNISLDRLDRHSKESLARMTRKIENLKAMASVDPKNFLRLYDKAVDRKERYIKLVAFEFENIYDLLRRRQRAVMEIRKIQQKRKHYEEKRKYYGQSVRGNDRDAKRRG
jgi:hypothetical protein